MLDGKVELITGAERGIGPEQALLFTSSAPASSSNDLGGTRSGGGQDQAPAAAVVAEVRAASGEAVANCGSVADPDDAAAMVNAALDEFDQLHILVKNAAILRDRMVFNLDAPDAHGQIFSVFGGQVRRLDGWQIGPRLTAPKNGLDVNDPAQRLCELFPDGETTFRSPTADLRADTALALEADGFSNGDTA